MTNWASVGLVLALAPVTAGAQSSFMADMIGQAVGVAGSGMPEDCLSLERPEKPSDVTRFEAEAEPALTAYLALARAGQDPSPAYKRRMPIAWLIDGTGSSDVRTVRDPWAARVVRLEPVRILLSRSALVGTGIWRAYDANDVLLGTYRAELARKSKGFGVMQLALRSPSSTIPEVPLTPYCYRPGDHEEYLKGKEEAAARKAARRAAAARPAS